MITNMHAADKDLVIKPEHLCEIIAYTGIAGSADSKNPYLCAFNSSA